jgi:hypothetical protein
MVGYGIRKDEQSDNKEIVSVTRTPDLNCVAPDLYIVIHTGLHTIVLIGSSLIRWHYRA